METGLWKQFDRIVVFDTETTGIEFGRDEICLLYTSHEKRKKSRDKHPWRW